MAILTTAAIGAGVIAATILATLLLPRDMTVTRSAQVDASPSDVIALLAFDEGYQKVNSYTASDEIVKITLFSPSSGVGSGFHFDGKNGKGSQTVARVAPPWSGAWRLISAATQLCAVLGYSWTV